MPNEWFFYNGTNKTILADDEEISNHNTYCMFGSWGSKFADWILHLLEIWMHFHTYFFFGDTLGILFPCIIYVLNWSTVDNEHECYHLKSKNE